MAQIGKNAKVHVVIQISSKKQMSAYTNEKTMHLEAAQEG